ncbi:MAG: hypothetical protein IPM82_13650 [Saprospiraceae bacterium]|nr:hypothetical protein [Saprospiraceae bacterium]
MPCASISTPQAPADTVQPKTYRVIRIKDGDSIETIGDSTKTTFVIRLAHVDCPEYKQPYSQVAKKFTNDFCYARQSPLSKRNFRPSP